MEGATSKMEKGLGKSMSNDNTPTFSKDSKVRIGLLWPVGLLLLGLAVTWGTTQSTLTQMTKEMEKLSLKVEEFNKTNLQLMLKLATTESNLERLKDRLERIEGTR